MSTRADILVESEDHKPQLVVEVKNKPNATIDWVSSMRRNLFVHSLVPESPYFLLVLPDHFYLWKNLKSPFKEIPPDYTIDAKPILDSYLANTKISLSDLSEYSLELIVSSWLNDLLNSNLTKEKAEESLKWIFDSGLFEAIKRGYVKTDVKL